VIIVNGACVGHPCRNVGYVGQSGLDMLMASLSGCDVKQTFSSLDR
jgi:hypothetical protein